MRKLLQCKYYIGVNSSLPIQPPSLANPWVPREKYSLHANIFSMGLQHLIGLSVNVSKDIQVVLISLLKFNLGYEQQYGIT